MKTFRSIFAVTLLLFCITTQAQKDSTAGQFSLGMRSTVSSFTDAGSNGLGAGGQFWIRVTKHMNTVWYSDYINTNIQSIGFRRDAHIGWSVVFYLDKDPMLTHKITPYLLAGQCFDYTNVYSDYFNNSVQRWSAAAAQGGMGATYKLTDHFDFSVIALYMMHLGKHVLTEVNYTEQGEKYLNITTPEGASLDGHLLITFSVNYLLGKL
ncbi:MAG TPA: hypothetical protein VK783_09980 [Bacteroidia bacterium]|jgi:hypothetical protein|nr:hypothetical protein [Bacteroidia bacterium]